MKYLVITLIALFCFTNIVSGQKNKQKPRVLILTDIENEPDDAQSMVRFLTYSNMFDVEGLVATTSCWQRNKVADWRIHEIVDAYGKVRYNLLKHEKGYPTPAYLTERIKKGYPDFGMNAVGKGKDSEGSDWIIKVVDKDDPHPVWIPVWGGVNCLAQALWKVKETRTSEELKKFVKKIRVYTISDQDNSGPWIRKTFPGLFYIVSPGYEENDGGGYHYATWIGISGDKFHGRFEGPDFNIVDNPWLDKNIRNNHGPLGAEHPHTEYLMEGDTPSFLYLINNGLGNPEHPDWGGWGGRYELYIPKTQKWFHEPETRPIWTNAKDKVYSPITKKYHEDNYATIWRWREAYQNGFAARIDWCLKSYEEANHPPVVKIAHPDELEVKSGEKVTLSAKGTSDPDNDQLQFNWMYYREAGTYNGEISVENKNRLNVSFTAPEVQQKETIHIILAVKDSGSPALTRYQRVIITVIP